MSITLIGSLLAFLAAVEAVATILSTHEHRLVPS